MDETGRRILENNTKVEDIIGLITMHTGIDLTPGESLIILDEIQESPKARARLKAFKEDGRYDVIASGSMLGVSDARLGTFGREAGAELLPVGAEEHMTMTSMDFEEFLWATGVKKTAIERVKKQITDCEELNPEEMDMFESCFRTYIAVGGMPESVKAYAEGGIKDSSRVLKDVLATCINDINRYNRGVDVLKTKACFDSIPYQLSESNKRFMYSRIDGGGSRGSAQKYMENLLWIKESGYGALCYQMSALALPIKRFTKKELFKVYLSDSGMLMQMFGDSERLALLSCDASHDLGPVYEHVSAECLTKLGYRPRFYQNTGKEKMEIDLIIEENGKLTAIEVKTGGGRPYPSLIKTEGMKAVGRRVIFERGNIRRSPDGVEHYPHFACAFLFPDRNGDTDNEMWSYRGHSLSGLNSSTSPMSRSPAREMICSSCSFSSSMAEGEPSRRETAFLFLGKAMTSRMESLLSRIATSLSTPIAIPPWGGVP